MSRAPVSLSKLVEYALRKNVADEKIKGNDDVIFAVVGTVTNDTKTIDVPWCTRNESLCFKIHWKSKRKNHCC